jgi:hypothetical protein
MPASLSVLQRRRQDAVKRYLADDPSEAIGRELGCAKSWLYKVEGLWRREVTQRPEQAGKKKTQEGLTTAAT